MQKCMACTPIHDIHLSALNGYFDEEMIAIINCIVVEILGRESELICSNMDIRIASILLWVCRDNDLKRVQCLLSTHRSSNGNDNNARQGKAYFSELEE